MRMVCVGGGPAGLYFAIVAKLADPNHEITVFERDPAGTTYGWAVTFRENLLEGLFHHDPVSAEQVQGAAIPWTGRIVRLAGHEPLTLRGQGYSIARATLLEILSRRALDLGVSVHHQRPVTDRSELADFDLVVAADGANSRVRSALGEQFGTGIDTGRNSYLWLGTEQQFDGLVFALERTSVGPIWLHGYPAAEGVGTCVIEAKPATVQGLGLDVADSETAAKTLEAVFVDVLDGRALLTQAAGKPARWRQFAHVSNARWHHANVVLVGDAAHTTHFSIGAGTREAIKDATGLAWCLRRYGDPRLAAAEYEKLRRPDLDRAQAVARRKMAWCEDMDSHAALTPTAFVAGLTGKAAPAS